jgi:hypothetical protein
MMSRDANPAFSSLTIARIKRHHQLPSGPLYTPLRVPRTGACRTVYLQKYLSAVCL